MAELHQYIDRRNASVITENLIADGVVNLIYSTLRENTRYLFDLVTSHRTSSMLSYLNFDNPFLKLPGRVSRMIRTLGIDLSECVEKPGYYQSPRRVFERQIKYWKCRPMPSECGTVVAPADSRMLVGSFCEQSLLFLKEKFFEFPELLGIDKTHWQDTFRQGDYAVFRLTPDKYHHNHLPVTGKVADIYEIDGRYHSCNPGAVINVVTPFSKNKRIVTILDTDVPSGDNIGKVAMIEVVALMIGDIQQCYSQRYYNHPVPVARDMTLKKGCPKSLFRPGSSIVVLIFEKDRVDFSPDILANLHRTDVKSRFTHSFQRPLVETEVCVRSTIASRRKE